MTPHLKGLQLTIDVWRLGRDDKLWPEYYKKAKDQEQQIWVWEWERESWIEEGEVDLEDLQYESPLELVNPAPRLMMNVEALEKLTLPEEPPETKCRVWAALAALYLVGDTSG